VGPRAHAAEGQDVHHQLSTAGISAAQINCVLQINAQKQHIPITWTYKDVYAVGWGWNTEVRKR
jgi:hypothetical protein